MFGSSDDKAILRGQAAQLSGIRTALAAGEANLLSAALEPFLRPDNDGPSHADPEPPLYQEQVDLTWQEEEEGEATRQSSSPGLLVLTREACLFCALGNKEQSAANSSDNDWYVPATSITLHALTGDDETSSCVYVQMEHAHDEECDPMEWTIACPNAPVLYAALSQLVSLHPIDPHQDTTQNDDDDDDAHFEPEDMIWASDIRGDDDDDDEGATEEERQAMLDRLDQVLIVPPEYEIRDGKVVESTEGQFDDAEEDEDDEIL